MLKKILKSVDTLFKKADHSKTQTTKSTQPLKHTIQQDQISSNALETIKRLNKAGFEAYLVGGCIRDLLINLCPKDFDIATNATPEQVKKIFHNSRIIGRRFKLAHVFWGKETLEVATFRGPHEKQNIHEMTHHTNGRILRDNVYGTLIEDAFRRDFTINALYYDINKKQILDYTNGLDDINNKIIKLIGNPQKRYQEDPVRMLRAVRFAAKLNFTIEPQTEIHIHQQSHLLADIPAARLFDEVLKLFFTNNSLKTFKLLCQYNLFSTLFPQTAQILHQSPYAQNFIHQALKNTDQRLMKGKTVNPAFLYSCFLWPVLLKELNYPLTENPPTLIELQNIAHKIIIEQSKHTTIPKRFSIPMREIWEMQIKLTRRQANKAEALINHPRFRAGYDFLLLRETIGEDTNQLGKWWTEYQQANDITRRNMIRQLSTPKKNPRNRRYNKLKTPKQIENTHD